MATLRPWPEVLEEDRWLIDYMEERFEQSTQTPDEMRARAAHLRAEADRAEWKGSRDMSLALAERYEQAAAARLAAR